jgi:hypothetical protein
MNWILVLWIMLALPSLFLYTGSGSVETLTVFGNFAKIFSLLISGISLTLTQNRFRPGDTPERAWSLLAAGMWTWAFGQILFGYYKLVTQTIPYPSVADVFFTIAYVPLLIGLILLIRDFRSTGLPLGSRLSYIVHGLALLVIYVILFSTLLRNFFFDPQASPALKLINAGYPTLDFLLICMSSVLVRISWTLRGGSLARSWILLCAGFLMIGAADILFAYHSVLALDALFFSGYFFVALAGYFQLEMLRQ